MNTLVKEVITNTTSFERLGSGNDSAMDLAGEGEQRPGADAAFAVGGVGSAKSGALAKPAGHRLQVHPRFPYEDGESHGCKLCPANLCKVRTSPVMPSPCISMFQQPWNSD